jgi:uncharacterized protein
MFEKIRHLVVNVTTNCNQSCLYCFEDKPAAAQYMSRDTFRTLLQRIILDRKKANNFQLLEISFHGGEPLLLKTTAFAEFLEEARALPFPVAYSIQTNGTLLTETWLDFFAKNNISVSISFDGLSPDANQLRSKNLNVPRIIRLLKKTKFSVVMCLHQENIHKAFDELTALHRSSKNNVRANPIYLLSKETHAYPEITGADHFNFLTKKLLDLFIKKQILIEENIIVYIEKFILSQLFILPKMQSSRLCQETICGGGGTLLSVLPSGSVHFCQRYQQSPQSMIRKNITPYSDIFGLVSMNRTISIFKNKLATYTQANCRYCVANDICDNGCLAFDNQKNPGAISREKVCDYTKLIKGYLIRHRFQVFFAFAAYKKWDIRRGKENNYIVIPRSFHKNLPVKKIMNTNCFSLSPKDNDYVLKISKNYLTIPFLKYYLIQIRKTYSKITT